MKQLAVSWINLGIIQDIDRYCAYNNIFVESKYENWGMLFQFSDNDWEKIKVLFD